MKPRKDPMSCDLLTTGQIARICGCAPRTVSKWIDSGEIKGIRPPSIKGAGIPGDRRVPRAELLRFMRAYGYPTHQLVAAARGIVLGVGLESEVVAFLVASLGSGKSLLEVVAVPGVFQAGAACSSRHPAVLVIDLAIGLMDAAALVGAVRQGDGGDDNSPCRVVAIASDETAGEMARLRADAVVRKPVDGAELGRAVWPGR